MTSQVMATAEDYEWCRQVARTSAKNFYYSFWTLPKRKQAALCTLYAFCRHCDDIVDMGLPSEEAADRIASTRTALAACFADGPSTGSTSSSQTNNHLFRALTDVIREFSIPREPMEEHIRGNEMDLTVRRYETFKDLRLYCYRVASTVGLMCLPVFGCRSESARKYAETLGLILQLTNIARDVKEDATRNRIYLPQEELQRFGVSEEDILAGCFTPAFAKLMAFGRERIEGFERQLDGLQLGAGERRMLLSAEIMRAIYAQLRQQMSKKGDDVFSHRMNVSATQKTAIALKIWWKNRAQS